MPPFDASVELPGCESSGDEESAIDNITADKLVQHSWAVSCGNGYRFPTSQFGYCLPSSFGSSFNLTSFDRVLERYMILENYCNAVNELPNINSAPDSTEYQSVDLFRAIFFPKTLAPRTPMMLKPTTILTEKTLISMWFRTLANYFEWISGVHEVQLFNDSDKIRLILLQLPKVVCFHLLFLNYHNTMKSEIPVLLFASGYHWDPARSKDNLIDQYCRAMMEQTYRILPDVKKLQISEQEFIIMKLVFIFDSNSLYGLSKEGAEIARSLSAKYLNILNEYVRHQVDVNPETRCLSTSEKDALSLRRIRRLLDLRTCVEKLAFIGDRGLANMVRSNYGGMQGTLQKQIHTESHRTSLEPTI